MIRVNGAPSELPADVTVERLVEALQLPGEARGVAVAVDGEVVPRGEWSARTVHDGAAVEIVQAVGGG